MFSYVKWTSCKQRMVVSFFIQRDNPYLLIGVFTLFIFNTIVDPYEFFLHALFPHPPQYSASQVSANSVFSYSISVYSNRILYLCSLSPWFMIQKSLHTDSQGDYWAHLMGFHCLREHTVLCCLLSNILKLFPHLFCPVFLFLVRGWVSSSYSIMAGVESSLKIFWSQ